MSYHPKVGELIMFRHRTGHHNVLGVLEQINDDRTYRIRVGAENVYPDVTYRELSIDCDVDISDTVDELASI